MSGRGNDNHMGTNHPREPFPLQITLTLRSPPNPIDVFPTSAAKITLRTVFAANREKLVKGRTLCLPTYRGDPAKVTFLLSVQSSMLTLAGTGGRLMQPPSGFPRITRERIGRSSRNLVGIGTYPLNYFTSFLKIPRPYLL